MKLLDINALIPMKNYSLVTRLRAAMKRNQLRLNYFPVIDVSSQQTVEVEVLLRWPVKDDVYMPPMEFLPIAEAHGLLPELTRWIIRTALHDLSVFASEGVDLKLSINLLPAELNDPHIIDFISRELETHALAADRLGLEIAEKHIAGLSSQQHQTLDQLHDLGVRLALDNVPVSAWQNSSVTAHDWDLLKIDWQLVMKMARNARLRTDVNKLINGAISRNIDVVVPGVHTHAEWECIRKKRYLCAQGFYFTPPQSHHDLETWFRLTQWKPASLSSLCSTQPLKTAGELS